MLDTGNTASWITAEFTFSFFKLGKKRTKLSSTVHLYEYKKYGNVQATHDLENNPRIIGTSVHITISGAYTSLET